MADNRGNRPANALARLRRALVLGLMVGVLSAIAVAALAITVQSARVPTSPATKGRSAVVVAEHHAVMANAPARPRADGLAGLGSALGFTAVIGALWFRASGDGSRPSRADRRLRWRARMVGAPPSFS